MGNYELGQLMRSAKDETHVVSFSSRNAKLPQQLDEAQNVLLSSEVDVHFAPEDSSKRELDGLEFVMLVGPTEVVSMACNAHSEPPQVDEVARLREVGKRAR